MSRQTSRIGTWFDCLCARAQREENKGGMIVDMWRVTGTERGLKGEVGQEWSSL